MRQPETPPLARVDFQRTRERFRAFWHREVPGRPLVSITAPRDNAPEPDFPVPDTVEGRWTDVQYQVNRARQRTAATVYLGDALPMFMPDIGPDSFTAYLGGDLRFLDDGTSWVEPFVDDLSEWTPRFDRQNRWWRLMCRLLEAVCTAAEDRFLVGVPDLHGGGDALSAARHPDNLALDLYDRPDEVRRVMRRLTEIYKEVYDEYARRILAVQEGTITWVPAWSPGRYVALQNDFSGLISPEMFEEFFLPEIRELAAYLDHTIYHLDGPSALGNLPLLLEVDELDGIQWVPGAGAGTMGGWVDVCRRVLEGGKCLQVSAPPGEVELLLSELPREGLFITTGCGTEREARRLEETLPSGT